MAESISEFGSAFRKFTRENGYKETEVAEFLYISRILPGILNGECSVPQEFYFYGRLSTIPFMGVADLYTLVKAARPPEWLEKWALKPKEGVDFTEGIDEFVNSAAAHINIELSEQDRREAIRFLAGVRRMGTRRELKDYVVDTTLPWRDYFKEN